MRRQGTFILLCCLTWPVGCATWDAPESHHEWKLPQAAAATDTITYEMAFIRSPPRELEESGFWRQADEQFLPAETKQRLAANGLRIGMVADPMPELLVQALEATRNPVAVITDQQATVGSEVLTRRERRQCAMGTTSDIDVVLAPVSGDVTESVVLFSDQGRVIAERFSRPRGYFRLMTHGVGDDGVEFHLRPMIDHGDEKPEIIGGRGMYRHGLRRSQRSYDELAVTALMKPGRILVITQTEVPKGLGAAWFADRFGSTGDQLVLLLRLANAEGSELFTPNLARESLVSPLE